MLKTIIVEDELHSRAFLNNILEEFCPDVQVIALAATKDEAINVINSFQPDLVFLDIELQRGTGFDVLKSLGCPDFQLVFTTASDHHAIKAIQFSGADYLLKPIDIESLQAVIERVKQKRGKRTGKIVLEYLFATLRNGGVPDYLYVPTEAGGEYIAIGDIITIEAHDRGADLFLRSGDICSSTLLLKEYENLLQGFPFYRTHAANMINLREIAGDVNCDSNFVKMKDGTLVPLFPKRRDDLKEMYKQVTLNVTVKTNRT